MTKEKQRVLTSIGLCILQHFNEDYQKTANLILKMGITDVLISGKRIIIVLYRPGLLIGKKGILLDSLEKCLDRRIEVIENEEPRIEDFIIPQAPIVQ
jgi:ribosomal protein S3